MKQLPTLTLQPVKHNEFYVVNGRLFRFNATTQKGELVLDLEEYIASKEVAV